MKKIALFESGRTRFAVAAGLGAVLAFGGVMAPVTPAFAAGSSSITIENAGQGKYKAYQLFTGSFVEGESGRLHLTNALTTVSYKNAIVESLKAHGVTPALTSEMSQNQVANVLTDAIVKVNKDGKAQKFANTLAEKLNGLDPTATGTAQNGTLSITSVTDGYYLIMADPTDQQHANAGLTSAVLMPVHGAATGTVKVDVPKVDKTVKDDGGAWDKDYNASADAGLVTDALSKLTYKVTASVPSNIAEFTSGPQGVHNYRLTFVDTMPTGLDTTDAELAGWNVRITCDGHDLSSAFTASVTTDQKTHTSTVRWTANDLKGALEKAGIQEVDMAGKRIVIEYDPTYDARDLERLFNNNATLENPQKNTVKVKFSNSPYSEGTGQTPDTQTKVYSYNLNLKKVDEKGANLTGAQFTLTTADGSTAGKQAVADQNGVFTFTGLESEVEYVLTEVKAPTGMKSIDPIHFVIHAEKNDTGDVVKVTYTEKSDPSNAATFEPSSAAGDATVNVSVVNLDGPELPGTGRAGIIGGIAVGGIVIAVSAAAMVRNRKASE